MTHLLWFIATAQVVEAGAIAFLAYHAMRIHKRMRIPFEKANFVPHGEYWQQDIKHCVCVACHAVVARFDERGVCANCVAEGK